MSDGRVVFEIVGDNMPIKRSLEDTTKQIDKETRKWDSTVDNSSGTISSSLIGAFEAVVKSAAFVKVGQMLLQLAGESIQLASDLEEVQNVVDVTFGEEGSKSIEKWSKNAISQFGLTELQAKRYASTLGAMMKSNGMTEDQILEMSTGLAGLAADMASFYNLPFDEAFSKIQSGMAGMSMPLRQLGIDMTETAVAAFAEAQGFEEQFNSMSQAEQMMLRYQYLMSVTSDAQGDFLRTSDSYANSQRRIATGFDTLKSQLGEALLPIATAVSDAVADLLEILTYTPPETAFDVANEAMADAAGNAAQAQGILGYMDKLQEKYGEEAKNTEEWAQALEDLKNVFPDVNQYINDETGALTASNEQLKQYVENSKQAAIEAAKQNAVKQLNDEYVNAGKAYYTAEIRRDIADEEAKSAVMSLIDYVLADYKARGVEENEGITLPSSDEMYQQFLTGQTNMNELFQEAIWAAKRNGEDTSVLERYKTIYEEQKKASSDASAEMETLKGTMETLEVDIDIANQALERLSAAADAASASLGSTGGTPGWFPDFTSVFGGAHAGGLDYVPYDGYIALLHKGERIQTAAEASLARSYGLQSPGFDYGSMSSAMWSKAPKMGGNVYLDGSIVGRVISEQQGRSYKTLQRSGWQG